MTEPEPRLFATARAVRLTAEEKKESWTFIQEKRTHTAIPSRRTLLGSLADASDDVCRFLAYGWHWQPMTAAFTLIMILGSSGAMVWAAESAVPGDNLYIMKTGVNELVWSWFNLSPKAKVEWELKLLDRRLLEAKMMLLQSRYSEQEWQMILDNFEVQQQRVRDHLHVIKESGDAALVAYGSEDFDTLLKAHTASLRDFGERSGNTSTFSSFLDHVDAAEREAHSLHQSTEEQLDYDAKNTLMHERIGEVRKDMFIAENLRSREPNFEAVRLQLDQVRRELDSAERALDEGSIERASELISHARSVAKSLRYNIAIEDVKPLILTMPEPSSHSSENVSPQEERQGRAPTGGSFHPQPRRPVDRESPRRDIYDE